MSANWNHDELHESAAAMNRAKAFLHGMFSESELVDNKGLLEWDRVAEAMEAYREAAACQAVAPPPDCPSAETFAENFLNGNLWQSVDRFNDERDAIAVLLRNYAKHLGAAPAVSTPRCPKCAGPMDGSVYAIGEDCESTDHYETTCTNQRHVFVIPYEFTLADFAQFFQPAPSPPSVVASREHKPWCASVPRPMDSVMGRGPYKCDCGAVASPQGESE